MAYFGRDSVSSTISGVRDTMLAIAFFLVSSNTIHSKDFQQNSRTFGKISSTREL